MWTHRWGQVSGVQHEGSGAARGPAGGFHENHPASRRHRCRCYAAVLRPSDDRSAAGHGGALRADLPRAGHRDLQSGAVLPIPGDGMSRHAPKPAKSRGRPVSPQLRLAFPEEQRVRREDNVQARCRACGKRFSLPRWYAEMGVRLLFCGTRCRKVWEGDRTHEPFHLTLRGRSRYRGGNWGIQAARAASQSGGLSFRTGRRAFAFAGRSDASAAESGGEPRVSGPLLSGRTQGRTA